MGPTFRARIGAQSTGVMPAERRQDPRVPFRVQTEVRFTSWETFKFVYMMNLSRGGLLLSLPSRPTVGDTVAVKLVLPNGETLDLEGKVKHAKEMTALEVSGSSPKSFRVGIGFESLSPEKRSQIERMIATRGGASGLGAKL